MTRGGDDLANKIMYPMIGLRSELAMYLEDVQAGWYDTLTKEDFIERVRITLDDLDEPELGAMYDQYIRELEVDDE
jgi:hypothetical protein